MTDTINAPFTRRFVIYEKDIEDEIEIVSPMEAGGLKSEQFLKMNPHGKVRPWLLPFYIYFQICPTIFYFLHTSIFYRVSYRVVLSMYTTIFYFLPFYRCSYRQFVYSVDVVCGCECSMLLIV